MFYFMYAQIESQVLSIFIFYLVTQLFLFLLVINIIEQYFGE